MVTIVKELDRWTNRSVTVDKFLDVVQLEEDSVDFGYIFAQCRT